MNIFVTPLNVGSKFVISNKKNSMFDLTTKNLQAGKIEIARYLNSRLELIEPAKMLQTCSLARSISQPNSYRLKLAGKIYKSYRIAGNFQIYKPAQVLQTYIVTLQAQVLQTHR